MLWCVVSAQCSPVNWSLIAHGLQHADISAFVSIALHTGLFCALNWSSIVLQEVALVIRLFCRPRILINICALVRLAKKMIPYTGLYRETAKLNKGRGEEPLVMWCSELH